MTIDWMFAEVVRYQCDYCDRDSNTKDDREIIEDDNIATCDEVDKSHKQYFRTCR